MPVVSNTSPLSNLAILDRCIQPWRRRFSFQLAKLENWRRCRVPTVFAARCLPRSTRPGCARGLPCNQKWLIIIHIVVDYHPTATPNRAAGPSFSPRNKSGRHIGRKRCSGSAGDGRGGRQTLRSRSGALRRSRSHSVCRQPACPAAALGGTQIARAIWMHCP